MNRSELWELTGSRDIEVLDAINEQNTRQVKHINLQTLERQVKFKQGIQEHEKIESKNYKKMLD